MSEAVPGGASRALAARLRAAESPNITYLADDFPVFWVTASGCTVIDADEHAYLDTTGAFGVAALGHNHPAVVRAVQEQSAHMVHGMGDVHPSAPKVDLCEQLRDCAPFSDGRVILAGGGAEAVEAALKTAALTTGRPGVIAFEGAYHGLSYGALATTHRPDFRQPWEAQLGRHVTFAPWPDTDVDAADALAALDRALEAGTPAGPIGAVIVEPIQGRAGIRVPPPGFLADVAARTRTHGALLIVDEIFTGLGRTGPFWACAHERITPDLLVCGKALGGGMPISACIGSPAAMAGWPASTGEALHTSTFLGNPVVCAAACAALALLLAPDTTRAATETSTVLRAGLDNIHQRHQAVTEVRGRGLMLGVVLDSAARCTAVMKAGLQERLILLPGGIDGNVLTITPPYLMTPQDVDGMLERFDRALAQCA